MAAHQVHPKWSPSGRIMVYLPHTSLFQGDGDMTRRSVMFSMLALGVALSLTVPAFAADKSHDGKVVSVTAGKDGKDGKLVMTDADGKNEHSHAIGAKVKITLNDKSAKLEELKKGDVITVTTGEDDVVIGVKATRK